MSRQNTTRKLRLVQSGWEYIEALARATTDVGLGDKERQGAVVLLLDEISRADDPRSVALTARHAAFTQSTELLEPALEQLLVQLRQRRSV